VSSAPIAATGTPNGSGRAYRSSLGAGKVDFREALDSEWAKIRTVRSTYWTLVAVVIVSIGVSVALGAAYIASWDSLSQETRSTIDVSYTLIGVNFGVLIIAVLGVMVISTEYSTGMIRTSLTALPRRGMMLGAKLTVLGVLSLAIGELVSFVSYFATEPFYASKSVHISLGDGHSLRAVLLAGVYLALVALIGFAFGALLRHTAGAISTTLGVMFVLPIITGFLPGGWGKGVNKVMPSQAGAAMMATPTSNDKGDLLSPLAGFLVLGGTVAALCLIALALFKRRDA
jgi:ABC-type transport system involved in multi-copper enzyme maturation permease subunit